MPNIDLINEVLHDPMHPYHFEFDNLPLKNILKRQEIINYAVDNNEQTLRESQGTQGSLSNRLNQSIDPDGSLKTEAINDALHHIGAHEEGDYLGTEYVIMTQDERNKLTNIADEATNIIFDFDFEGISTTTTIDSGTLSIQPSETIEWYLYAPNIIKARTTFPSTAVHNHFYSLTPVHVNIGSPDYINYKTTSVATAFIEDSLRIYINGIRIFEDEEVYVYGDDGPDGTWALISFTPDHDNGTFELSRAISVDDIIMIDFDTAYV